MEELKRAEDEIARLYADNAEWKALNSRRVDEINQLIDQLRELRADNARLRALLKTAKVDVATDDSLKD